MRLLLAPLLASLATPALAASHIGIAHIEVTDPTDRALTLALDRAVSDATDVIGACRAEGHELTECVCTNREALTHARAALAALLDRQPGWKDKTLYVDDNGQGQSLTIWLDTVARGFAEPDCG